MAAAALSTAVLAAVPLTATAATAATPLPVPPTPANLPTAIEPLPAYVPQDSCDPTAKPGVVAFEHLLLTTYPDSGNYGIGTDCQAGSPSEHYEGRAFDWKVSASDPAQVAEVDAVTVWLLAPDAAGNQAAMARRLGIMYMIWNHHILGLYRLSEGWRAYSGPDPHTSHVHFSFTWAGARGRTSYWTGSVAAQDFGPCLVDGLAWASPATAANPSPCPPVAGPAPLPGTAAPYAAGLRAWSGIPLAPGSTGPAVTTVQQALGVTADGGYGPVTANAVDVFQGVHALPATGRVDDDTWRALLAAAASPTAHAPALATPAPTPVPVASPGPIPRPAPWHAPVITTVPGPAHALLADRTRRLTVGTRGSAVVAVQRIVRVGADGAFGPHTRAAVIAFQRAHHLSTTGVVDSRTWPALITAAALDPYRKAVLRIGARGTAVCMLQWALGVTADGAFGAHTADALEAFQLGHRLRPTVTTSAVEWTALGA